MALTLAISVLATFFAGNWLDKQFDTGPWFTIIGTLWGAGGGTAWVVLKVKRYGDAEEKRKNGTG
ncbi:AtpZ/AtpI family protein [bacterium]|nr:AtpZ/AtpI family protein [bacterium]